MQSSNILILAALSSLFLGCASTSYKYKVQSPNDPHVKFVTNYSDGVDFFIGEQNNKKACINYNRAGYIQKKGAVFIALRDNVEEINTRVEPNKELTFKALYKNYTNTHSYQCGPISRKFIPLSGKKYKVNMHSTDKGCLLAIYYKDQENSQWKPQKTTKSLDNCSFFLYY